MIGLDTNVLVRYLTEDDPEQSPRAVALVERALEEGERLFVPQVVLCELVWVLDSVYHYSLEEISLVLRDLLRTRQLVIEDLDTAWKAVDRYAAESGVSFARQRLRDGAQGLGQWRADARSIEKRPACG